jgi:uncharacterized protein DUF4238
VSVPEKHHFLPRFYLERWASGGKVTRFVRPRGAGYPIHRKSVAPAAVAYERNLYEVPTANTPAARQMLELEFYQRIDDRAAIALDKIDREQHGTANDRIAFAQFVLSLLLRNPAHIEHARNQLRAALRKRPDESGFEDMLTAEVNLMLADIIQSPRSVEMMASMKVFKIGTPKASLSLLTSGRPTMLSHNIPSRDGFILFPYAPDKMIALVNDPDVASAFYTQEPDALVRAINDAVVVQAQSVVIGGEDADREFVDQRFLRPDAVSLGAIDQNGMVRWRSPLERRRRGRARLLGGIASAGSFPTP